ncbi:MAG: CHAD domain-containing protein [Longimicrobiales bacterium]
MSTIKAGPTLSPVDDLPVSIGVRLIARRHLDDAMSEHARLHGKRDSEALHDFRVALRRLRSTIRAFRAALDDTVKQADRRSLRSIARATSVARDLEVQLEWLRRRARMRPTAAAGARLLADSLRKTKVAADRRAMAAVARFGKMRDRLDGRLARYTANIDPVDPLRSPTTAETAAATAILYSANLSTRLSAVRGVEDGARVHGARIAGKRLRYLLEPFQASSPNAEATIERLKALQDDLGTLHDLDIMVGLVAAELARATKERQRRHASARAGAPGAEAEAGEEEEVERRLAGAQAEASGAEAEAEAVEQERRLARAQAEASDDQAVGALRALEEHVRLERDTAFHTVRRTWLTGDARGLFKEVDTFAAALRAYAAPEIEIERKFLLSGMPRRKGSRSVRIDQGWLPGHRLRERIRRIRSADGPVRYYRAIKSGRGVTRREVEEETTEQVFRTLWPLTRGRRVSKRRMIVDDGAFTWEIDRFYGRDLVLAEVELPSPDTPVVPPRWLARWIVREVTGEPVYLNSTLAG